MKVDAAFLDYLQRFFLPRRGDSTVGGNIIPDANETHNLGSATNRYDTVYAKTLSADTLSGSTSVDTVDGFHAYASPQPDSLLALDGDSKFPTSTYPSALLVDGTRNLTGNLTVDPAITIDGVDISNFKSSYDTHVADPDAHHDRVTVTGTGIGISIQQLSLVHGVTPTTIQPDDAASEGSDDKTARGDHRHAIAAAGPTTTLTGDTSNTEGSATSFARSDHIHAISTGSPTTPLTFESSDSEGSAATLNRSDHSHSITNSANPGGTQTLLSSNSAGGLQLLRLGIGVAVGVDNWIQVVDGGGIGDATGLRIVFDHSNTEYKLTGGDLAFQQASAITTASGSLTLTPASNVELSSAATIKADNWASGINGTGWGITYAGAGDFRSITAEELHVQSFIAEIYQAFAGAIILTQSRAIVNRDFTIPNTGVGASLYVQDLEGWVDTPVFAANDYVLLRVIDMSNGGLVVQNVWGQVTAYDNETVGDGEQKWTFTTTTLSYSAADVIYAGSLALDYGPSGGGGIWSATVLDAAGAPYSQVQTWDTITSGEPSNFTTHVRTGELTGLGFTGEYGLWAGQDAQTYLLLTDTSFEGHGLDLKLYQSTTNTIWLKAATPAIVIGTNAATDTYASGNGIWMGNDSGTYKMRIGNSASYSFYYTGVDVRIYGDSGDYLKASGTGMEFISDGNAWFTVKDSVVTVGRQAGGEYVKVSSTGVELWGGAVQHGWIASTGTVWFGDSSSTERMQWDSSNGFRIINSANTAVIKFPTSGNAQIVGTLTLTSPGEISAGGGNVIIDATGLEVIMPTDKSTNRLYFTTGGTTYFYIDAYGGATKYAQVLTANAAYLDVGSYSGSYYGKIRFLGTTTASTIQMNTYDTNGSGNFSIGNGGVGTTGSLTVGATAVSPSTGEILATADIISFGGIVAGQNEDIPTGYLGLTGAIRKYENSTLYDTYAFKPLTTPQASGTWGPLTLTSTSGSINLNSIFSMPDHVKAILLEVNVRDSGTWPRESYWACGPSATYWYAVAQYCYGSDRWNRATQVCPVADSTTPTLWWQAGYSGSGNMDVLLRVWGYWI